MSQQQQILEKVSFDDCEGFIITKDDCKNLLKKIGPARIQWSAKGILEQIRTESMILAFRNRKDQDYIAIMELYSLASAPGIDLGDWGVDLIWGGAKTADKEFRQVLSSKLQEFMSERGGRSIEATALSDNENIINFLKLNGFNLAGTAVEKDKEGITRIYVRMLKIMKRSLSVINHSASK